MHIETKILSSDLPTTHIAIMTTNIMLPIEREETRTVLVGSPEDKSIDKEHNY